MDKVVFKPIYWSEREHDDEGTGLSTCITIGGETETGETVHVQITDFDTWAIVEFPPRIKATASVRQSFIKQFCSSVEVHKNPTNLDVVKFEKFKLTKMSREIIGLRLRFKCRTYAKEFAHYLMFRSHNWDGVNYPRDSFRVHEHHISDDLKFCTEFDIPTAGWLEAKHIKGGQYATTDHQLVLKTKHLRAYEGNQYSSISPRYLCFDIETTSVNHNSKLPDPNDIDNEVFQISMIFGRVGDKSSRKVYLLTLFDPQDVDGATTVKCKDEATLLVDFSKLIRKHNPSVIFTYNGIKFDWHYLIRRAELRGVWNKFADITRVPGVLATKKEQIWQSSAYGEEKFNYLDMAGRTDIDVLIEIRRNHKLNKYSLEEAASYFLGSHKDDISPRELFISFDINKKLLPLLSVPLTKKSVSKMIRIVRRIMVRRKCSGRVREIRDQLLRKLQAREPSSEDIRQLVCELIHLTGKYCVKDTLLTMDLAEHLSTYTGMEQLALVMKVPMSYLHTRGTQIKVQAMAMRHMHKEKLVVPYMSSRDKKLFERYEGAVVFDATPGMHDNVVVDDFQSLYPTRIHDDNICPTKYRDDTCNIPDSQCNIIEGETHMGCIHDKKKNRTKKRKDGTLLPVVCGPFRYRFEKALFNTDGTVEGLGLFPRIVRDLMDERIVVRELLAQKQKERDSCTDPVIKSNLAGQCVVLDAKQMALKITANAAYGGLGAQTGALSCVPAAASVTARGRELIVEAVRYITQDIAVREGLNLEMIYGDTDSCMISYKNMSPKDAYALGQKFSLETTHHLKMWMIRDDKYPQGLPDDYAVQLKSGSSMKMRELSDAFKKGTVKADEMDPYDAVLLCKYLFLRVNLQMENMYHPMLQIQKKLYCAQPVNSDGLPFRKDGSRIPLSIKGLLSARRDNSKLARTAYNTVVNAAMDRKDLTFAIQSFFDVIQGMLTRRVPDTHFIVYTSVKTIINYATKNDDKKFVDKSGKVFQVNTISKGINVVIDERGKEHHEEITEPDPLDPRLVYKVLQARLALKMIRRGDDVPPNTRLEYIISECDSKRMGDRVEDYTYYRENRTGRHKIVIDKLEYLSKLVDSVQDVINCAYPSEVVPKMKAQRQLEWSIRTAPPNVQAVIKNVKSFARIIPASTTYRSSKNWGWYNKKGSFLREKGDWMFEDRDDIVQGLIAMDHDEVRYIFKKRDEAVSRYIVDSMRKRELKQVGWRNELDGSTEWGKRLKCAALRYISSSVMAVMRKKAAYDKGERTLTATDSSNTMRTEFMLLYDYGDEKAGSLWTKKPGTVVKSVSKNKTAKLHERFVQLISLDGKRELEIDQDKLCAYEHKNASIIEKIYKDRLKYSLMMKEFKAMMGKLVCV